jgi:hypothetical protein
MALQPHLCLPVLLKSFVSPNPSCKPNYAPTLTPKNALVLTKTLTVLHNKAFFALINASPSSPLSPSESDEATVRMKRNLLQQSRESGKHQVYQDPFCPEMVLFIEIKEASGSG